MDQIDWHSLRSFVAVAEEGHITRAAESLNTQQPWLSMRIRAREKRLDVQLLRRKFLCMGVDPTNCKAISGNMFEQRFNVAASHARDRMDVTRFNRHLLRSKLNWSDYHEDSEIPSRMFVFAVLAAARQLNLHKQNLPGVSAPQDYKTWPPKLGINAFGQSPHGSPLDTLQSNVVCAIYL